MIKILKTGQQFATFAFKGLRRLAEDFLKSFISIKATFN